MKFDAFGLTMAITYSISPPAIQGPVIACTVFGALATLTTGLRLYAMHLKGIRAGISEYTLLIGLVCWVQGGTQRIVH